MPLQYDAQCALASNIFSTESRSRSISIPNGPSCRSVCAAAQLRSTGGAHAVESTATDNTPGWLQKFPEGGHASLESIHAGLWRRYEPQSARILASRFIQITAMQMPCYFALQRGEFLQGLIATIASNQRLYVVTVPAPAEHADQWPEWPRIARRATSAS
jgi:hypothetical protein